MNGPDHYVKAEQMLDLALGQGMDLISEGANKPKRQRDAVDVAASLALHANLLLAAQVHAILALTAAQVAGSVNPVNAETSVVVHLAEYSDDPEMARITACGAHHSESWSFYGPLVTCEKCKEARS